MSENRRPIFRETRANPIGYNQYKSLHKGGIAVPPTGGANVAGAKLKLPGGRTGFASGEKGAATPGGGHPSKAHAVADDYAEHASAAFKVGDTQSAMKYNGAESGSRAIAESVVGRAADAKFVQVSVNEVGRRRNTASSYGDGADTFAIGVAEGSGKAFQARYGQSFKDALGS